MIRQATSILREEVYGNSKPSDCKPLMPHFPSIIVISRAFVIEVHGGRGTDVLLSLSSMWCGILFSFSIPLRISCPLCLARPQLRHIPIHTVRSGVSLSFCTERVLWVAACVRDGRGSIAYTFRYTLSGLLRLTPRHASNVCPKELFPNQMAINGYSQNLPTKKLTQELLCCFFGRQLTLIRDEPLRPVWVERPSISCYIPRCKKYVKLYKINTFWILKRVCIDNLRALRGTMISYGPIISPPLSYLSMARIGQLAAFLILVVTATVDAFHVVKDFSGILPVTLGVPRHGLSSSPITAAQSSDGRTTGEHVTQPSPALAP